MSPLHEELAAGSASGCLLCGYLKSLSLGEKAAWDTELRAPVNEIGNTSVVKALKKRGLNLTEASVRRHRSNH